LFQTIDGRRTIEMSALQLAVRGVMVVVRKRPDLVLQVLYSDVLPYYIGQSADDYAAFNVKWEC
jgi:hypothetical protein